MDSLITVMNKLQDVFSTVGTSQKINLPQIVVVGAQSSGKSSVLESLVGKSFLPRGTGIVTRAPLVLHLISPPEFETESDEPQTRKDCATFLHKPDVVYHDFDKVRKEIESQTEILAGDKKNVTDRAIVLNVYTRRLYNLSFVDLPGLTKVPIAGQPRDIEQKIQSLVLSFIENPNSIILAVVTANTDPATSESLHLAKTVDPEGNRTIAVVTKIDIMDAGTDANELLSGKVIPVKLGIFGVINRSQKDINDQKTIEYSMENEKKFFQNNYKAIADQHGTDVLGKRLQFLLIQKIKETFPSLKKQIYDMNIECGAKVRQFREFTNNYDRSLLELITRTATSYKASLDGQANNKGLTVLNGGAKIAHHFKFEFGKEINKIDPLYGLSNDAIINVLKNASGTSMGVFMPEQAFVHLVKIQLQQMEGPSLNCVNIIYEELVQNMYNLDEEISHELRKYPKLMEKIFEVLQELLNRYKQKTTESVSKLIRYQEAFINTDHPDFIEAVTSSEEFQKLSELTIMKKEKKHKESFSSSESDVDSTESNALTNGISAASFVDKAFNMRQVVENISTCIFSGLSDTDKLILESRAGLLVLFIKSYFKVIKKIIQDTVPKTIMYEMVNNVRTNFQKDLVSKVYKSNDLKMAELLLESTEIVDERIKSQNRFEASEKALKLMREIEQLCHVAD